MSDLPNIHYTPLNGLQCREVRRLSHYKHRNLQCIAFLPFCQTLTKQQRHSSVWLEPMISAGVFLEPLLKIVVSFGGSKVNSCGRCYLTVSSGLASIG